MSPPDLSPFWRVLEHIKAEYMLAKSSGETSKAPPGQWCYEYCTARRRGADVGYVDESCLCGYEKEELKREVDGEHVEKRSLEKRQRFFGAEDAAVSDVSTDTVLSSQTALETPTPTSTDGIAGVTAPAEPTNNGGAPPLATVSQSTVAMSTSTSEATPTSTSDSSSNGGGLSSSAKIGIGVGVGVGLAALIALLSLIFLCRRKRRNTPKSSAKYLPQQQSDLSMVEATPREIPPPATTETKPTHYNSYEIYSPPQQQEAYEPPSATLGEVFPTPVSAITPQTREPPGLVIPDHAPSPTGGNSPVSPVSPVSALSSRPPSPKHGGGGGGGGH